MSQPPAYTVLPPQQPPAYTASALGNFRTFFLNSPIEISKFADEINKICRQFCEEDSVRGTGFGGAQPIEDVNIHNDKVANMLTILAKMLENYKLGLIAVDDENKLNIKGFNDSNRLEVLFYQSCERNTLDTLRANVNQTLLSKFESRLRNFASGLS